MSATEKHYHNHPGVAAVLSFVFNGLGQLYNGEIKKGLIIMTVTSLCLIVIIIGAAVMLHWLLTKAFLVSEFIAGAIIFLAGVLAACVIGAYSITDAYRTAERKN